ncbi:MAG: GIY-YIG nuclease family protein [Clostridia bacterium]|nr:GIY-YIG nuclease family protein [Clostridia bacterium]
MINLCELLQINKEDFVKYKVHFAIGRDNRKEPYNNFLIDSFKDWQELQTNKNWSRKYILSLIYYEKDIWMFGGVYKVLPVEPTPVESNNGWKGWRYQTELTVKANEYIGRAFFRFKKEFRASYPMLELEPKNGAPIAQMPLSHILDKRVALTDFLGFDSVNIDYKTLKYIVSDNILSWKSALSNVKGIYLIVDTYTGKQYVGSAYGDECIWQRWQNYAKDGHGGNVELQVLLKENGTNYKYNFKYSILEVCNMNLGNEYIITRESHWKEVLLTRQFGLNLN